MARAVRALLFYAEKRPRGAGPQSTSRDGFNEIYAHSIETGDLRIWVPQHLSAYDH
jgi:hypothetical protein